MPVAVRQQHQQRSGPHEKQAHQEHPGHRLPGVRQRHADHGVTESDAVAVVPGVGPEPRPVVAGALLLVDAAGLLLVDAGVIEASARDVDGVVGVETEGDAGWLVVAVTSPAATEEGGTAVCGARALAVAGAAAAAPGDITLIAVHDR